MRHYRVLAIVAIIIFFWSVAAEAATLRLKDEHHGVWGLVLEAAKAEGASRTRAANVLSLVIADNRIDLTDLDRLPNGLAVTVQDRYFSKSFRPSRQVIQMSEMIFDLDRMVPREEMEARLAREREAAKRELAAMEVRAKSAETERDVKALELKDKDTKISELKASISKLEEAKRPSAAFELFQGLRDFFRTRPFAVAVLRYLTALALVVAVLIVLGLALQGPFGKRYYFLLSKQAQHLTPEGVIGSETEVWVRCKGCLSKGKPEGQSLVLLKNYPKHLEKEHGRPRPRAVTDDEDMIIGSAAKL